MSRTRGKKLSYTVFVLGVAILATVLILLRLTTVTDYMYHALVKDPTRTAPDGRVVVAPADGTVLYVKEISDGIIPEVVKKNVSVPVLEHLKTEPIHPFNKGYLIGTYMNTHGVHVNRVPNNGKIIKRVIFNGPHMDMTEAETALILSQLIPGYVTVRKMLGWDPYRIENKADYILKSARETLVLEDERGAYIYIVRIADYYVGKILTWVKEGSKVKRGQKLGMITWGSQADIFIEDTPGMNIKVNVGDYVYAGETVLATY